MKNSIMLAAASAIALSGVSSVAVARDHVEIVGSSTVYPFATVVAEQYGRKSGSTPKIESTGSGGGLKLFCNGMGANTPDITNASRRIKQSEIDKCAKNGIKDIVEVRVGYDGIVVANSKQGAKFDLTTQDLALALAKQVPGKDGKLIDNPYSKWSDVRKGLPNIAIEVLGPPPSSGTRDAFAELALEAGFKKYADYKKLRGSKDEAEIKALMEKLGIPASAFNKKGKKVFKKVAHALREDGKYIEMGENDNLIIQKLIANPNAVGVFGFSFLDQNADKIQGASINGKQPTFEAIADSSYPISRPLQFYVKKAHVGKIPGIEGYLAEFTSEKAFGEEGYLSEKGLIPMPKAERECNRAAATQLIPMKGHAYACAK
jgi:phosphate transport system substrate-binding protein